MDPSRFSMRTCVAALLLSVVGMGVVAGCGGEAEDTSNEMSFVYVNWAEGIAMTHLLHNVLEDSLGMDVEMSRVNGGGLAFSSVASENVDSFVEAWLPTTHSGPWEQNKDDLKKLGYTYRGTSVGLTVPAYMDIDSIEELPAFREAFDGRIHGIEAGAQINDQTRQILENNGIEGFEVVASSGPATWQLLEQRIENRAPVIVTGWSPHWKWTEFDLKYIDGAKTGDTPVFGGPEAIFTLVTNDFVKQFPEEAVCFLKAFEVNHDQIFSLMEAFRGLEDQSQIQAAEEWAQNHPEVIREWMVETDECVASPDEPTTLPDTATYTADTLAIGAERMGDDPS